MHTRRNGFASPEDAKRSQIALFAAQLSSSRERVHLKKASVLTRRETK
jgi:hypothetical protein